MFAKLLFAVPSGCTVAADDRHRYVAPRLSLRSRLRRADPSAVDRFVDVASVILISVAAVLTAVCSYQSGKWDGEEARLYNLADANRAQAVEASDKANVLTAIDVALFLQYIDAVDADNARKAQFIYHRLRPEMRPAMQAWLAARPLANANAPSSPFVMPQYKLASNAKARRLQDAANVSFRGAQVAKSHADQFLLLTVIFAGVSFLGGVSTKMLYPRHVVIIGVAAVGLLYGTVRLAELPFLR